MLRIRSNKWAKRSGWMAIGAAGCVIVEIIIILVAAAALPDPEHKHH